MRRRPCHPDHQARIDLAMKAWMYRLLLAVSVAATYVARWQNRRVGLALVYHGVAAQPDHAETPLSAPQPASLFAEQLHLVSTQYRVVCARDLPHAVATRRRGQRFPVAITFDDDLRSHVTVAAPLLAKAGVPATFFLCGNSLDGPRRFWWQLLETAGARHRSATAEVLGAFGLSPQLLDTGMHELGIATEAMTVPRRAEFVAALEAVVTTAPDADLGLRTVDVRALLAGGHEIGFHTRDHPPLASLDDDALIGALETGRAEFEREIGTRLSTIAYPHGSFDRRVIRAARKAGWRLGFTLEPTAATMATEPLAVGRIDPYGVRPPVLALQMARAVLEAKPS